MKTRILYVNNYLVNGGPSNVVRNLVANLEPAYYDVTVLNLFPESDPDVIKAFEQLGAHVIECNTMTRMGALLGKNQEFKEIVNKNQYDVIHTHGFIPDILASRLKTSAKRISTIHNNMFEDYVQTYGNVKSKIYIPMHLHALKKLDKCVCCAKSVYDVMKNYLPNTSYVRNGIDSKECEETISRKSLGIPEDAHVFIYAGQLSTLKRTFWLTEQFNKVHAENEYLLMLGQGEQQQECLKFEGKHIKFLGFQKNVRQYLQMADVYVSASCSEGFSIAILEALECGLGLLLSDIPSHREVLEIDKAVYLGENFDFSSEGFESALIKIRKNYSRISKKQISSFKEQSLSGKHMTERYEIIYNK